MCSHDFFHLIPSYQDIHDGLLSFYTKPCSICGSLPTLTDLVDRILLLAFEVYITRYFNVGKNDDLFPGTDCIYIITMLFKESKKTNSTC